MVNSLAEDDKMTRRVGSQHNKHICNFKLPVIMQQCHTNIQKTATNTE